MPHRRKHPAVLTAAELELIERLREATPEQITRFSSVAEILLPRAPLPQRPAAQLYKLIDWRKP